MAAAAVVSVSMGVMKPVLDKLTTLMGDEYKKVKGLRKMVTFLQLELRDMDALLEQMDSADELNPQAKNWRKDIIDMSYNIEDCIDDFMQRVGQADNKVGFLRKAFKYLSTFKDRYHLANQFQEIKAQVTEASERRQRYMLDQSISITTPVAVDPRLLAIYYKDSASLVGIDGQKIELVNWATDRTEQLKVMAIVGFGGLGKTTLATEVYREVGGKFDSKAFVSVSQKPQILGLFNSLLSQLGLDPFSHTCEIQDPNKLQGPINKLIEHLQNKSYFIVVDDLWDTESWDTIQCAFPQNNLCNRVMITTRNENVARSCCNSHGCIYNMRPLSKPDSKKLFFHRIFGSEDACPPELQKASSEILKKCDGLPLAIITMASLLACQLKRSEGRQWECIQNSLATNFETKSKYERMMYILDLSYRNLPHYLKACFLYLGSYPEDHTIDRVELVRRWVAEGFVSNSTGQDVWDVANWHFNELVNRSMIQPTYDPFNITIISGCRVHDMLLELILRRCEEDNFLSVVNGPQAVADVKEKVIRRLTIDGPLRTGDDDKVDITTAMKNLAQIRSLSILEGRSNWMPLLLQLKFVRVLSIMLPYRHDEEMTLDLTVINRLSQLRYLKVLRDGKKIIVLCQIKGLPLLQTLDLSGIRNCSVSLEIVDAPRLSHLLVPTGSRLPDGIGNAKSLRTLCGFILPKDSSEGILGLGKLTALSDLRLSFPNDNCEATWMIALGASLYKLGNLKKLVVSPFPITSTTVNLCADDALSSLSPPFRNLEEYKLRYFIFSRVPRWIGHLHNLRLLWIGAKQVLQEDVGMLGTGLLSLVDLYLRIPAAGVQRSRITIGGFPALKRFWFDCDAMSLLAFAAGAMPALRELNLTLYPAEWDKAAPAGLEHLPRLESITVRTRTDEDRKAEDALIQSVFQEKADALPTPPALTFNSIISNQTCSVDRSCSHAWIPLPADPSSRRPKVKDHDRRIPSSQNVLVRVVEGSSSWAPASPQTREHHSTYNDQTMD